MGAKGRRIHEFLTFRLSCLLRSRDGAGRQNARARPMLLGKFHAAIHPNDYNLPLDSACRRARDSALPSDRGIFKFRAYASSLLEAGAFLITRKPGQGLCPNIAVLSRCDCRGFCKCIMVTDSAAPSAPLQRRPLRFAPRYFQTGPASLQFCHWLHSSEDDTTGKPEIFSGRSHGRLSVQD